MPPKSNVPIRIGGSRDRAGCRTCKQRHLKCPRQQPICDRCAKAKRECVYDVPASPDKAPLPNATQTIRYLNHTAWPILNNSISPPGTQDPVSSNALQHFTTHLGKELAGCFSDRLWCDVLPRVARHEPSLWHGMVAVATLDMELRKDPEIVGPNSTAILHYSKALQSLHIRLENVQQDLSRDVVLLACIVFTVFECLQNHHQSTLRHVSGGLKLLSEWLEEASHNNEASSGTYLDRSTLQSIFLSLDSQAIQLGMRSFREFFSRPALEDNIHITEFNSFDDAHALFNQIFRRLSHRMIWVEPVTGVGEKPTDKWMQMERAHILAQLGTWDAAFERFAVNGTAPYHLLLVQRKCIQAVLDRGDGLNESEWDRSLPAFKDMLFHAEAFLTLIVDRSAGARRRPLLLVAMDVVMPLFLIATRCRDSAVRWRALKLLKNCNRQEGIWSSVSAATIAEHAIMMEESAAVDSGKIPEEALVCMYDVECDEESGNDVSILVGGELDQPRSAGSTIRF